MLLIGFLISSLSALLSREPHTIEVSQLFDTQLAIFELLVLFWQQAGARVLFEFANFFEFHHHQ